MVLYPLLPETPYWLVLNGDLAAAEAVLQRMARINGVPLPEVLLQVLAALLVEPDIEPPVECCMTLTRKVKFGAMIRNKVCEYSLADEGVRLQGLPDPCLSIGKKKKERQAV